MRLELVDAREHAALTTANTGGRSRVWQDVLRGVEERWCGGLGCVVDETVDQVEGTDSGAVKACEGRNHLRKPVKTIKLQMKPYKIRMSIPEQFLTIIDKYFSFETSFKIIGSKLPSPYKLKTKLRLPSHVILKTSKLF